MFTKYFPQNQKAMWRHAKVTKSCQTSKKRSTDDFLYIKLQGSLSNQDVICKCVGLQNLSSTGSERVTNRWHLRYKNGPSILRTTLPNCVRSWR